MSLSGRIIFFFNDTATTEIYTLSLHDALPICPRFLYCPFLVAAAPRFSYCPFHVAAAPRFFCPILVAAADRKSTRLNSSHTVTSYAVFCLKKKKTPPTPTPPPPYSSSIHFEPNINPFSPYRVFNTFHTVVLRHTYMNNVRTSIASSFPILLSYIVYL